MTYTSPVPVKAKPKKWPWIVGIIAALTLIGSVSGGGDDPAVAEDQPTATATKTVTVTETAEAEPVEEEEPAEEPSDEPTEQATPKPKPKPTPPQAPALTVSQENAIESAWSYLDFGAFSRAGLIDQLSSEYGEGYSLADATFAVDHIKVNWNAEAVESAKSYLDFSSFSRQGLIDQLTSPYGEQFAMPAAIYAANQVGL